MEYKQLEYALNQLSTQNILKGPFEGLAGCLEFLERDSAKQLVEFITRRHKEYGEETNEEN